jgi:hypothetical protein
MTFYDPKWRADGRPDKRRYPMYLIALFWSSIILSLLSVVVAIVATYWSDMKISASAILILSVSLGALGWIAKKSETASIS